MACCDYPGCGKSIYVYNKERNITIKQKAHTVPTNQKQRVIELLKLGPEKARKVQLILCHDHFRKDAYSETNSARLRRDVQFADLLIVPGSGSPPKARRSLPMPVKLPRPPIDLMNRTIASVPAPKMETNGFDVPPTISAEFIKPIAPPPPPPPQPKIQPAPAPVPLMNGINRNPTNMINNENKSKLDFDMKKFRIEVTMKHLLKEKELESRIKASESEMNEYKSKLEAAQGELNLKKEEMQGLRAELDELRKELNSMKSKLEEETKQRIELEKKNAALKNDLLSCELVNQNRSKRVKLEKGSDVEEPTSSPSKNSDDIQSLQSRLRELEEQLRLSNERREADINAKEKELAGMKKEIKDLHLENQQLYDANIALDMDIRAYRKLVQFEEQRTIASCKKRRTNDSCMEDDEPIEPILASPQTAKAGAV